MMGIEIRAASDADIVRVYAAEGEHIVGAVDGKAVAYISFRRIGDLMWGIYNPLEPAGRSVWTTLFYAFRRELRRHTEPVYVVATNEASSRVLKMLGFELTGSTQLGKDVWRWTPGQ